MGGACGMHRNTEKCVQVVAKPASKETTQKTNGTQTERQYVVFTHQQMQFY